MILSPLYNFFSFRYILWRSQRVEGVAGKSTITQKPKQLKPVLLLYRQRLPPPLPITAREITVFSFPLPDRVGETETIP